MTTRIPGPPKHLSADARRWWRLVLRDYALEPHHVRLLAAACEAWDRKERAREVIDRDGPVYLDRWGQPHARPEVAIERDSRLQFVRILRELALDSEPGPGAPRPPALR